MSDNRPTHHLNIVTEYTNKDGEIKRRFHEIAPLWTTEKGNLSGEIPDGVTITGRLLVTAAKRTADTAPTDTAAVSDSVDGLSDT